MAKIQFKNLAASTLIEDVATTSAQLKIVVADKDKFPTISAEQYFIVAVINSAGEFEIMRVIGANNGVFTVMRSQEGTAAKAFQVGDRVEHRLTAESLVSIVEEASVTKFHTAEDADTYGHATSTLYSHVKITDDPTSSASAILGIGISPYAVKTRFDQLAGATTQQAITASGNYTVPETGTYEVICVGGGGNGGTGGYAGSGAVTDINMPGGGGWYLYSGGGAGGGGAGQTITKSIALTKGTVIPMVVGAAGGATSFGTHATALAGSVGNNGGNASCVHTSFYDCGTSGGPGGGGAGGYSYGSAAGNGAAGTGGTAAYATYYGGTGGKGGVSIEGTYGNGGKGSDGGWVNNPMAGDAQQFHAPVAGTVGTQGCIKIRMVLGA